MIQDSDAIRVAVEKLAQLLLAQQRRLVTAESCTGGGIGFVLTDLAGSSRWLEGGFVSYSNEMKQQQLSVTAEILREHGAVSEQTAGAMAAGALRNSSADYSVSVTGIAGPTGGSKDKPTGTVCFGWAQRHGRVQLETQRFSGDRAAVREKTIIHAVTGMLGFIEQAEQAAPSST